MPSVLITEFMDQPAIDLLAQALDVQYAPELFADHAGLIKRITGHDALIVRNRTQVTAEVIKQASALKVVGRLGVGLDDIDLQACNEHNVYVAPATGANAVSVAEYVMGAIFTLYRPISDCFDAVTEGQWPRTQMIGHEIAGKTLGLVGMGEIAAELAKRASAFGMQIAYFDPYVSADSVPYQHKTSLDDLLSCADCVSLHVPLTDQTRKLFDANRINCMKPGALLINSARGGVVDEAALVDALRSGHLGGAAIDVFDQEPLDKAQGQLFAGVDRLILTPHVAGVTLESNERVSLVTAMNVLKALGHA